MMVVNAGETNAVDQKLVEYELWEKHSVPLIRRSLTDIADRGFLNEKKQLVIDNQVVSVSYYRSGYTPKDYPEEKQWEARIAIERSDSIKCPTINYHLIGTKKIQQVLAKPGCVERFMNTEESALIRTCFAGLFSLDPQDNPKEVIEKVRANSQAYVMKPQREGGGNLLFNEEMVSALETQAPEKLAAYIIMDRIVPKHEQYYVYYDGQFSAIDGVPEIGTFGTVIGDSHNILLNEFVGTLVRTKKSDKEDGGVVAGRALLDSLYII